MTISTPIADGSEAPGTVTEADPLRVASWPNAVTGLRIVMVPVLVGAFFVDGQAGFGWGLRSSRWHPSAISSMAGWRGGSISTR